MKTKPVRLLRTAESMDLDGGNVTGQSDRHGPHTR